MGMTDKQFNSFLRLLLDDLKDAAGEQEKEKILEKIEKIMANLQKSLED